MKHFNAIIIGGQAGPSLAARFSDAGKTVAIIERYKSGGSCVNTGCIPTKTMVASAYAAHIARRGGEYGFTVNGDVRVDMKRVKARKDAVSGRSNKGVEGWLRGLKNCTAFKAMLAFSPPTLLWSMRNSCKPTKFISTLVDAPLFRRCRGSMLSHFLPTPQ